MIAPPIAELERGHLRIARALHRVLSVVAPHEQPKGSPRAWLTFNELGLSISTAPRVDGFAQAGLDTLASEILSDDRCVGRPTFAVSIERVAAHHSRIDADDRVVTRWKAAEQYARVLALHEFAHAVLIGRDSPGVILDRAAIGPALCGVEDVPPGHEHGPDWWRLFVTMMARAAWRCPRDMAWESFAKQVGWYRYGSPSDASRWITAAQQCRRLFHVPLIDTLDLAMPAFDDLVCELYVPPKVGAAPAAA